MAEMLEKFIGLVFLFAGVHRIYYKDQRIHESEILFGLPRGSDILIMIFEILGGLAILLDSKWKRHIIIAFFIMVIVACILMMHNNSDKIIGSYNELFTFKDNSISLFLHITYIAIMAHILIK